MCRGCLRSPQSSTVRNLLASQSIRYSEGSAVNHGSRRSRDYGADMAGNAADLFERGLTCLGRRSCRENRGAWRNPRPADELSEVVGSVHARSENFSFAVVRDDAWNCA
jgi:hypothetical protein